MPLLLAQASWRMGRQLRALHDPADVVNDVWLTVLPRLAEIRARDGRETPVLLKYLSTAVLHHVNNLMRKHLRRGVAVAAPESLAADVTGVITAAVRREISGCVLRAIDGLEPTDRDILILRGVEQRSVSEVAAKLGIVPATVYVRFHRARQRFRDVLPGSVLEELDEDAT